jgi:hypothetical protein
MGKGLGFPEKFQQWQRYLVREKYQDSRPYPEK